MNVGLLFVPVSVYQMLRGALVLFVGLFSVLFLGRRLARAQWMALATVMLGVAVVGFSSVGGAKTQIESFAAASGGEEADPLLGVCLILVAQILCVRFCGGNRKVAHAYRTQHRNSVCSRGEDHGGALGGAACASFQRLVLAKAALTSPQLAVGYEGFFGLSTTLVGLPLLYVLFGRSAAGHGGYFDAPTGWNQIVSNPTVWGSSVVIAIRFVKRDSSS